MISDKSKYLDLSQYKRVLTVAETPSMEEFMNVLKITGAGLALLGVIAYLIYVVVFILPGGV